jgi:predicted DNA-binding transcriptional regulator AlpA
VVRKTGRKGRAEGLEGKRMNQNENEKLKDKAEERRIGRRESETIKRESDSGLDFKSSPWAFFDNLPELLRPKVAAKALGLSVATIYDWKHRQKLKKIPPTIFLKINQMLYLHRNELRKWITSLNAS